MPKAKLIPTLAGVARHFNVSETSVYKAKRHYADFPAKRKSGYHPRDIDAFCKRHSLWHYRPAATGSAGVELREARKRLILDKAANLEVTIQRLLLEQSRELGNLISAEDFDATVTDMRQTVLAIFDKRAADVAALLADAPEAEREKVLALMSGARRHLATALGASVE